MIESTDGRLRLCAVTDDLRDGPSGLVSRCLAAERGGATMLLLRLKHAEARTVMEVGRLLVSALTIPVIVNERLDVALACGAAGVHVTSDSMPVVALRPHVAAGFLIGRSVSSDRDVAGAQSADYVTIGPVAGVGATAIGLEGFQQLALATGRPALAVGGIGPDIVPQLLAIGACGIAVISAVLSASDPEAAARQFCAAMTAP